MNIIFCISKLSRFFTEIDLNSNIKNEVDMVQRGNKLEIGLKEQAEQEKENEVPNQPVTKELKENTTTVQIFPENEDLELYTEINVKQEVEIETKFETQKQEKNDSNHISSSEENSTENEELTSSISEPSVTKEVAPPVRVSAETQNFSTTANDEVTNVAKKEDSNVTDAQTLQLKHPTSDNFPAQNKPTHPLTNATKPDDLSDEIYSGHEGSAYYELSLDSNDRNDVTISQESDAMSEGSSDMQLNMHLALENDKEYGSGEQDHVKQQIVESTEKEYFTAIENEFEEGIDEAFLEVNNKVPRLLQASAPSNNKLSNDLTTIDDKKEFTAETDITSDQFLIDLTN